ncbi:hypothetical protein [Halpernia sp. GG3]
MKNLLIIHCLMASFVTVVAQQISNLDKSFYTIEGNKLLQSSVSIDGTPYLYPFMNANVEGVQGSTKMRYNANNDEVEYETANGNLALLKQAKFSDIYFLEQNMHLKLVTYNYDKATITGYLYLLVDTPNLKIFKREHINYYPEKVAKSSYDTSSPPSFIKADAAYFVQRGTSGIVELPSNKKQLIELFPDKKEEIKNYLKDNKLNYSNKNDVQKLAAIL